MQKRNALILSLVAAGFVAIIALAATVKPATAVDNPCDPTPGVLKACKDAHGRFSAACCCCITH